MITYLYFIFVALVCGGALFVVGAKLGKWLPALALSGVLLLTFGAFYYFYLEQMFVKRWGGVMSIQLPRDSTMWRQHGRMIIFGLKIMIRKLTPVIFRNIRAAICWRARLY